MPTLHLAAKEGSIAPVVIMPGDPARAQFIAEHLYGVDVVSQVRKNDVFTGYHNEHLVSVLASGMGQPSLAIYVHELFTGYQVKEIVRFGTCGALKEEMNIGDVLIADSGVTHPWMPAYPTWEADLELFTKVVTGFTSSSLSGLLRVGRVISVDDYYNPDPEGFRCSISFSKSAGVDMETAKLYELAKRHHRKALTVNVVSDSLVKEATPMSHSDKERGLSSYVVTLLNSLFPLFPKLS